MRPPSPSRRPPQVLADYQISPKETPTGHGPLGAPTNQLRKPLRWFDPEEFPEVLFDTENYRPPHPIGVKGGCSPQNNRERTSRLLNELPVGGNKFYVKNFRIW